MAPVSTAQSDGSATKKRSEKRVADSLYRTFLGDEPTNRYRYARLRKGVRIDRRFTAPTLREARDYASQLASDINTNGPAALGDRSVTIEQLVKDYLRHAEQTLSPNSVAQRRRLLEGHVVPALGPKLKAADI